MNKIEYVINCLDGTYTFKASFDQIVSYEIDTDIQELNSYRGELNEEDSKAFISELNKAQIEKWDREYKVEQSEIEDGVDWKLKYIKDDKEYVSYGKESYVPYGHEYLINAIDLCDRANGFVY